VSSVSDFEYFAKKVKKQISIKVEKLKVETSDYLRIKEHESEQKTDSWSKHARIQWDQECYAKEQQSRITIENEANREWFKFKKKRELALRSLLKMRLEEIFPVLAECFISKISQEYETGIFTMPEAYIPSVKKEGFLLQTGEKEEIIFTSGNLYIEYSVERIMEELDDEIVSRMLLKEDKWQK